MPALRDVPKVPTTEGPPKLSNNLFKNTSEHRRVYTNAQQ